MHRVNLFKFTYASFIFMFCNISFEVSAQTTENLQPVLLNEFFEYQKNPHFEESEKIGTKIPYYARRMFEVRASRDPQELSAAKVYDETTSEEKRVLNPENSVIEKITLPESTKIRKVLDQLKIIYKTGITDNFTLLCTYLKESGTDLEDSAAIAINILNYNRLCFQLSVEESMPLNYVNQLNNLKNDLIFKPLHVYQIENQETYGVEQVQFIFNDILFRFFPMDQEEYYDSQLIVAVANLALRSKQSELRYYQLNDDYNVVLGTKEEITKLCTQFNLNIK